VNCNHANPAGYIFCSQCGEALEPVLCRCGFVTSSGDRFCGRCGVNLAVKTNHESPASADHLFDLEQMVLQAAQEQQFTETTHKVRVTQDDIRKLLETRRKRF
jgi:hypothetical protein